MFWFKVILLQSEYRGRGKYHFCYIKFISLTCLKRIGNVTEYVDTTRIVSSFIDASGMNYCNNNMFFFAIHPRR